MSAYRIDADCRVPNGVKAIQIGDDWPGFFLRGDETFAVILALETIAAGMDDICWEAKYLRDLANDMRKCHVGPAHEIAP